MEENRLAGMEVSLYHPSGAKVRITISTAATAKTTPASIALDIKEQIEKLIAHGFTVDAPGLEEGEIVEEVGAVLKTEHESDGRTISVLLLYSTNDRLEFPFLKVYLDKEEDVDAFVRASKMRLISMPLYEGSDKLKRDGSKLAKKYIIDAPRPFKVVSKKNPGYSEEERKETVAKGGVYKKSAKRFVRWVGQDTAAPSGNGKPANETLENVEKAEWWTKFLLEDPPLDAVTARVVEASKIKGALARPGVAEAIESWKSRSGAWWDGKSFQPPKEPEESQDHGDGDHMYDDPIPF